MSALVEVTGRAPPAGMVPRVLFQIAFNRPVYKIGQDHKHKEGKTWLQPIYHQVFTLKKSTRA